MSDTSRKNIKIGVSACLLGQEVRYDGGQKKDPYVTDTLGELFELVPVCPEVEVGMSTPREPIQLQGDPSAPELVAPGSDRNWTKEMSDWSRSRSRELAVEALSGFVFKKNSPSCGLFQVPVIQKDGSELLLGRGFFAAAFARVYPLMPTEDEARLSEPSLRANFLERVFAYHRVHEVFRDRWLAEEILEFHGREKHLLMTHSPEHYRELDRLVGGVNEIRPAAFRDQYLTLYMGCLSVPATPGRHLDTLQSIAAHLQGMLSSDEQRRIIEEMESFGAGTSALGSLIDLLRHYFKLHRIDEAMDQSYLNPHWLDAE